MPVVIKESKITVGICGTARGQSSQEFVLGGHEGFGDYSQRVS